MKRLSLILLVVLFGELQADTWEIFRKGTSSANFLLIGADARSLALGGEGGPGLLHSHSLYWNTAAGVHRSPSALTYEQAGWLAGMTHQVTEAQISLSGGHRLQSSLTILDVGREEITTELSPQGTGQYYSSQFLAVGAGYARPLTDRVAAGFMLKVIQERIWLEEARNVALDLGLEYVQAEKGLKLGMSLQNMGPQSRLEAGPQTTFTPDGDDTNPGGVTPDVAYQLERFPLPLMFRLGASRQIALKGARSLLVNTGISDGLSTPFRASLGIEANLIKALALRGGYRLNSDTGSLTLGFGIQLPLGQGRTVRMDYCWLDMGYFGDSHRYQLGLDF